VVVVCMPHIFPRLAHDCHLKTQSSDFFSRE
jgi:hypothetical protein